MLPDPFIKIDGFRESHQAEFAVSAGASAVGLIFADARRRVTVERAREIVGKLRRLDGHGATLVVGVFVEQGPDEVNRVAELVGLDAVQLHGSEPPSVVLRIERPVLKVIRGPSAEAIGSIAAFEELCTPPTAYLVDGQSKDAVGGTGERADWVMAKKLARSNRLILAGGLTPDNVGDAIRTVRPFGVDVSSGVETDGVKDRAKVIAFVAAAQAAFAELNGGQDGIVPVAEAAEPIHRP